MTSKQGFHDESKPAPPTPGSSTDGLLQLQPFISLADIFQRADAYMAAMKHFLSIDFTEIQRGILKKRIICHLKQEPDFVYERVKTEINDSLTFIIRLPNGN